MKHLRNPDNGRLSIRIDPETKREMTVVANKKDISLARLVKALWEKYKRIIKDDKII